MSTKAGGILLAVGVFEESLNALFELQIFPSKFFMDESNYFVIMLNSQEDII